MKKLRAKCHLITHIRVLSSVLSSKGRNDNVLNITVIAEMQSSMYAVYVDFQFVSFCFAILHLIYITFHNVGGQINVTINK